MTLTPKSWILENQPVRANCSHLKERRILYPPEAISLVLHMRELCNIPGIFCIMYVNTVQLTEDAYAKWFIQFNNSILVEPVAMDGDKGESRAEQNAVVFTTQG